MSLHLYEAISEQPRASAKVARPISSKPPAYAEIFCLHRHDGVHIRQIQHPDQTRFPFADLAPGFRRNDLDSGPWREMKMPLLCGGARFSTSVLLEIRS
jgi:hypothetical protein